MSERLRKVKILCQRWAGFRVQSEPAYERDASPTLRKRHDDQEKTAWTALNAELEALVAEAEGPSRDRARAMVRGLALSAQCLRTRAAVPAGADTRGAWFLCSPCVQGLWIVQNHDALRQPTA